MKEKDNWEKEFEVILPLIVEDYNNFIAEACEIGELDIEEIWEERVKPFIRALLTKQREEEINKRKYSSIKDVYESGRDAERAAIEEKVRAMKIDMGNQHYKTLPDEKYDTHWLHNKIVDEVLRMPHRRSAKHTKAEELNKKPPVKEKCDHKSGGNINADGVGTCSDCGIRVFGPTPNKIDKLNIVGINGKAIGPYDLQFEHTINRIIERLNEL